MELITEKLLNVVSDWTGTFAGAYKRKRTVRGPRRYRKYRYNHKNRQARHRYKNQTQHEKRDGFDSRLCNKRRY